MRCSFSISCCSAVTKFDSRYRRSSESVQYITTGICGSATSRDDQGIDNELFLARPPLRRPCREIRVSTGETSGARVFLRISTGEIETTGTPQPRDSSANTDASHPGGILKPKNSDAPSISARRGVLPRRVYFGESRDPWTDR